MQVAEEDAVTRGEVASIACVDAVDDDVQRRLLVLAGSAATVGGLEFAWGLLQFDVALVRLDQLVVVQAQLALQIVHLHLLTGDQLDQPAAELVLLLHVGIEHPDNLTDEPIPADERPEVAAELVAVVLVLGQVAVDNGLQDAGHLTEGLLVPHLFAGQPGEEGVDVPLVVDSELAEDALSLVDKVHVDVAQQHRLLVERLEGRLDVLLGIHEVEHVGVLLPVASAVQAGQGLHGLHALELRVHHHRVQERLVEAGLVLVRHDETVEVLVELLLGLEFADVGAVGADVQARLGVLILAVLHDPGEGHEDIHVVVSVLQDVPLDLVVVAHGGEA